MCILIKSAWGVISDSDQFFFRTKKEKKTCSAGQRSWMLQMILCFTLKYKHNNNNNNTQFRM